MGTYTNLNGKRHSRKEVRARKKAEYLASLPKNPAKRLLYRMHPRRFFAYWFSRQGFFMMLKITGVAILFLVLMTGALFAYFRQELDAINPEELAKRVQTTVTRYYDRNGVLLWEDRGENDYRLVVETDQISQNLKDATIAIEDQDFYNHSGVSVSGIARATVNNFQGGDVQGGSTLTQQLVKQVFISEEEAQLRGINGVPRKIKESILAIEVERKYNKEQILTLYLNESPYGGRRNGVESGAQTYFGKSANEVTIAEAALLAAIPQSPGLYNPYNEAGHDALLARQQHTIDNMERQGMITADEAKKAKKAPILDQIIPEADQFKDVKAPHFVQTVRSELERELGKSTVGEGGLNVITTLDVRAQDVVENAINELFASDVPLSAGFSNGAATVVDSPTGQVLAMQGSRDYFYPDFGQDNAATAYIQPGSSIKPLVFAGLFQEKSGENYGAGTILSDEPINDIYGGELGNFDNQFKGNLSIRDGLAQSRNIPAVKAMYINGRDATLQTIQEMGDKSYCTDGNDQQVGLAAAIGGCGLKQVEHTNAFATFARMGQYKPVSTVLEVTNNDDEVIMKWEDDTQQAIDPQIAYIINDILADEGARAASFGPGSSGFNVPGVRTSTKTGTSNIGDDSKDLWMMSYTPRASLGVWVGNNDTSPMNHALSSILGPTVDNIMAPLHHDIFGPDGTWSAEQWYEEPAGVQHVNVSGRTDMFPSWYNQSNNDSEKRTFDSVSKKLATDCTPDAARVELDVRVIKDPVTNREVIMAPDGYNGRDEDDVHKCDDKHPFVNAISASGNNSGKYTISVRVNKGTHDLQEVEISVNGQSIGTQGVSGDGTVKVSHTFDKSGTYDISATVRDSAHYEGTASQSVDVKVRD